jgi:hypothetical protein
MCLPRCCHNAGENSGKTRSARLLVIQRRGRQRAEAEGKSGNPHSESSEDAPALRMMWHGSEVWESHAVAKCMRSDAGCQVARPQQEKGRVPTEDCRESELDGCLQEVKPIVESGKQQGKSTRNYHYREKE